MKIIFFGAPEFGAIILEQLIENSYKPILVITSADKPLGRKQILTPSPVKITAKKYNIKVEQPEKIKKNSLKEKIEDLKPDLGITAAFGKIIPKEILNIPKFGFLNVHPSLLPKYRGPSPIQTTILQGNKTTGVTIILMDEKIDHGPIISNIQTLISKKSNYQELHDKLAKLGGKLLLKTIPKWTKKEIKPKTQDESKATYTKILKKQDGKIRWSKPANYIEKQIRAFNPWPGTYTFVKFKTQTSKCKTKIQNLKLLRILEGDVLTQRTNKKIGEVFLTDDKKLAVQCGQNCLILLKLQIEGGKPISYQEFLNGHKEIIGKIFYD